MVSRRGRHFRVGLVMLGAAGLFTGLISFTIGASLRRHTYTYFIRFVENVKGMVVGSKVNFQGVPAGQVTGIHFADGHSLVEVEVGAERCLVQDVTRARLDRLLVTGQVTVELEGFESGRPRLPSGAGIPPATNPIGELTKALPDMVDSVPVVLRELSTLASRLNVLLDEENCARIERVLINVEHATGKLPRAIDAVAVPAERATVELIDVLKQADAALADLRGVVGDARGLIGSEAAPRLLTSLSDTATRFAALQQDLAAFVAEARSVLTGNRAGLGDAVSGFRDAMREVRALARLLQLAPSSLIYGRQTSEPAAPGGER